MMIGLLYGKKTILVFFDNNIIGATFKFEDFFESLDIKYEIKNKYDSSLLENVINVNYNKIVDCGLKMIEIAPFIPNDRKNNLKDIYNDFFTDLIAQK